MAPTESGSCSNRKPSHVPGGRGADHQLLRNGAALVIVPLSSWGAIPGAVTLAAVGPMPSDSSLSQHPPKPRLTLRVGVTGHRPNKLDGALATRIREQLPEVFDAIERATAVILANNATLYADEPAAFRLVCGFAEGADQLAVATCPPGWRIEAILPFPRDDYLRDFAASAAGDGRDVRDEFRQSLAKAAVVTQLPAPSGTREQGYAEAGGFMLRQIDILVAVWDGKPAKAAGTGTVVREAAAGGIPVIWLSTEDEVPPRLITRAPTMGDPQAATFEWN